MAIDAASLPQNIQPALSILTGQPASPLAAPAATPDVASAAPPLVAAAPYRFPTMQAAFNNAGFPSPNPQSQTPSQPSDPTQKIMRTADEFPPTPEPGSWARGLVASAQKVLSGSSFGDISNTPTKQTSGLGGFIEGLSETAKNRDVRQKAEQQQQFENEMKLSADKRAQQAEQREDAESHARIGLANMQVHESEYRIRQLGTAARKQSIADDAPWDEMYQQFAPPDYSHLTFAEMMAQHIDPGQYVTTAVGTRNVGPGGKNSEGAPDDDAEFNLYKKSQPISLNKGVVDQLNETDPPKQNPNTGQDYPPNFEVGDVKSFDDLRTLYARTQAIRTATASRDLQAKQFLDAKEAADVSKIRIDPKWGSAMTKAELAATDKYGNVNPQKALSNMVANGGDAAGKAYIESKGGQQIFDNGSTEYTRDLTARMSDEKALEVAKIQADSRELDARNKLAAENSDYTDAFGNRSPLTTKRFDNESDKLNNDPMMHQLHTLQASRQQYNDILGGLRAQAAQGKPIQLSGPEGVAGLFDAVGITSTPLAGKGFRVSPTVVNEHIGARGLQEEITAFADKMATGTPITPGQLEQYAALADKVYQNAYVNTADEQFRRMGYVDIVPPGHGEQISPVDHSIFLKLAHGNANVAARAEEKSGWSPAPVAPAHTFDPVGANATATLDGPNGKFLYWKLPNGERRDVQGNPVSVPPAAPVKSNAPESKQAESASLEGPKGNAGTWTDGDGNVWWIDSSAQKLGLKTMAPPTDYSKLPTEAY